jgi:hypothetical protein
MLAVLLLVLPGCRKTESPAKAPDPTGTYTLATINGSQLPFTVSTAAGGLEFQASTITLQPDKSFTSTMTCRMPRGEVSTRDSSGRYTTEGAVLKLDWSGARFATGVLVSNTLTIDDEGMRCMYRKSAAGGP